MRQIWNAAILAVGLTVGGNVGGAEPIPGVGPTGHVVKVQGDFQFLEGPVADGEGTLYFTDIPADTIYRATLAADGKATIEPFVTPSGHANGLMIRDGKLLACQMDGQVVAIDLTTKVVTPVAEKHDGHRFNAPNDLVTDEAGGVYFTDPAFRAPMPLPQGTTGVYYVRKDGRVTRLIDDLANPNGVILSPDGKTLYVIPSGSKTMMQYPVEAPGKLGRGKPFCDLKQAEGVDNGGGDGLTVDTKGNLYITSRLGVQVVSPEGKHLGTIAFPEQPANCTFAGPGKKVLFATCRTGLYMVPTEATGAR